MSPQHATQTNDKAATEFANPVALAAFAGNLQVETQAKSSDAASGNPPQMASLVDLIDSTSSSGEIEINREIGIKSPLQRLGKLRGIRRVRRAGWPVLNMTTGLLSNAFPTAAPLFHGCLAFLQLKLHTKNQADTQPTPQGPRVL